MCSILNFLYFVDEKSFYVEVYENGNNVYTYVNDTGKFWYWILLFS
jgi:hypothetical protein